MDSKINPAQEQREKQIALQFFTLLSPDKLSEARQLFTPDCRHHNPFLPAGMDALLEGIRQAQKRADMPTDGVFSIRHVIVEEDMVAVHTTLQSQTDRSFGMRQAHLFRFEGDKIDEYWDITQMAAPGAPNVPNMF